MTIRIGRATNIGIEGASSAVDRAIAIANGTTGRKITFVSTVTIDATGKLEVQKDSTTNTEIISAIQIKNNYGTIPPNYAVYSPAINFYHKKNSSYVERIYSSASEIIFDSYFSGAGYDIAKFSNTTMCYLGLGVNFGVNEKIPETAIELTHASPYFTFHCPTETDTAGGRASKLLFKGEQSGGEETTLASMVVAHDGAADDQKGYIALATNSGTDGNAPTERMRIDSAGLVDVVGDLTAGTIEADNGFTGSFTNGDGDTVTVVGGIITNIA